MCQVLLLDTDFLISAFEQLCGADTIMPISTGEET